MNKLIISFLLLALVGCSSSSKKAETKTDTSSAIAEAPAVQKEEPLKQVSEEPVRPQTPVQPSQHAILDEAIKAQSDDRIYQAATQILIQSPNDVKSLNALAMYHYKRGRFDLSKYLLNKAISANPKTAELYSNLGITQLAQNEKREAIQSFRKALSTNPNEAVAAANLGSIYVQDKDYSKAQVVLEMAYRKGMRDARILNNYAIALTGQKKYSQAQDMYKAILKENGNNKEALYNYATLLVDQMGQYQEGLELINRLKFVGGPADTRNRIIALENKAKAGLK